MTEKNHKATGVRRVINAFRYSVKGLHSAFKFEAAFRQEIVLATIMIPLAFWLDTSQVERLLMVGSVILVLIVELLNSAVEAVVDRTGTQYHELSGRAKDLGSAAVFLSLLLAGYIWGSIIFF